jgi:fibronectin-binding autotransporter adhesin
MQSQIGDAVTLQKTRRQGLVLLAAATAMGWGPFVFGAVKGWNGESVGNWSVGPWDPVGLPVDGDSVRFTGGNVSLDVDSANLSSLSVQDFATLSIPGNTLTVSGSESLGIQDQGTITQSGGNNNIGDSLMEGTAGTGTYTLSGGYLNVANSEFIGMYNLGTFTQTGGVNTIGTTSNNGSLNVGSVYLNGTYTLGAGILVVNGSTNIGQSNRGSAALMSIQAGTMSVTGTTTVNTTGTLNVGGGSLTTGGLTLDGGSGVDFGPGIAINVSTPNGVNLAGPTTVTLNGDFTSRSALINYSGVVSGSASNLTAVGGTAGMTYSFQNDLTNHSIDLVPSIAGTETTVAKTGQTILSQPVSFISNAVINNSGQLAFGPSTTILRQTGSSTVTIASQNSAAPGGGVFAFVANPTLNSAGQVAFSGAVGVSRGIFRGDGTSTVTIGMQNQTAPGGGKFGSSFSLPGLNSSGQVAFSTSVSGSPADGARGGIFVGDGNSTVAVARQNQSAPDGGLFNSLSLGVAPLNNKGQVVFSASLSDSPADGASSGIFRGDGTTNVAVARVNQSAPGGGSFSGLPSNGFLNDSGQVAFGANLGGAPADGAASGVFRWDGNSTVPIARGNQIAPGGGTFTSVGAGAINNAGQVLFDGNLTGAGDGAAGGIFVGDGNSIVAIARVNQPAPDGGTFEGVEGIGMNNTGQVLLSAQLGVNTPFSLFVGDGTQILPIAVVGQTLNGILVASVTAASINDYGQVAYVASLSGQANPNANGAYMFTPVLHWRTSGDGGWDTRTNWTIGLTPAVVHDVVIDPATSLTVTGPTGDVSIKSLGIGGGAGAATLLLSGGGNLNVVGAVTIAGGSTLGLANGSLTVPVINVGGQFNFTGGSLAPTILNIVGGVVGIGAGAGQPIALNGLTFSGTTDAWVGKLDLTTDQLMVHNGDQADIANALKSGFNAQNGYWNGAAGILSSAAASDTRYLTTLGYRQSDGSEFDGVNTTTNDVLVKYTYYGDANLDGTVNGGDYQQIDNGFGLGLTGWSNGDFNYDGVIDGSDFSLIDNTFNQITASGASPLALLTDPTDLIAGSAVSSVVPEPATLGIFAVTFVLTQGRRRRKRLREAVRPSPR